MFECQNPEECGIRAARWLESQRKYAPRGQRELASLKRVKTDEPHQRRQLFSRSIDPEDIVAVLCRGRVIHRDRKISSAGDKLARLLVVGEGLKYRGLLHVVVELPETNHSGRMTITDAELITAYDPKISKPWQWSADFTRRICWCTPAGWDG